MHKRGLDFDTGTSTLRELISNLYEKASSRKMWWLVRHTAGMLSMRPDDLEKSIITIVVRQKQLSIGIPTNRKDSEIIITKFVTYKYIKLNTKIIIYLCRPATNDKISELLNQAWEKDISMIVLTQELLVYLGLFISTEPQLFQSMIRIRTGLIIQVMVSLFRL